MKYDAVMDYLEEKVNVLGSVMGLDTLKELLDRLGNPQKELQIIHVAGTNGKGSICTFLTDVLIENGYRVGRYLSPVLTDYREKIQVNRHYITKTFIGSEMEKLFTICEEMLRDGFLHPTTFELETALAFVYFKEKKCDYVVLECGMGGLEDATNVIDAPLLTVFASISMDHMAILGNTIEEIASVKAGILKRGSVAVSAPQRPSAEAVLKERCKELEIPLHMVDRDDIKRHKATMVGQRFTYRDYKDVRIPLLGVYQIENASVALLAVEALQELGVKLSENKIRKGLENSVWSGRFEVLGKKPYVIMDGAHNEAAVQKLTETIAFYFTNKRIIYIMGVLKDKDYSQMIQDSCGLAEYIVTVTPPIRDRALPAYSLAEAIRPYHERVTAADSIEEALEMAALLAGDDGVVIAFGSLSYLGALKAAYMKQYVKSGGNNRNGR